MTLRLYVHLEGAFPPVWRRIEVGSDLRLEALHDVLQVVFGWEECHLHRFTTGPERDPGTAFECTAGLAEGFDDEASLPTRDVRGDELLAERGERLQYQYDYGDNWWLTLHVEEVVEGRAPPGLAVLLDIIGDGVKLTAARYLHPAVVQTVSDDLDMCEDWIGKGSREDQTMPVLYLRETAHRPGVGRRSRRTDRATHRRQPGRRRHPPPPPVRRVRTRPVLRWREARRAGLSDPALHRLLAEVRLERISHGLDLQVDMEFANVAELDLVVVAAANGGSTLCLTSALGRLRGDPGLLL